MYRNGDAIRCGYDFNPDGPFLNRLEGRAGNIFLVNMGLVVQLPIDKRERPAPPPGYSTLELIAQGEGLKPRTGFVPGAGFKVRSLEPRPILMTRRVIGVLKTYYGHAFGTDSDIIIFFPFFSEQVALMAVNEVLTLLGVD